MRVCVVYVCVFCSGGGNWCRQDLKWLFSCLTEDKREEKKRTNKVAILQERRGRAGERERERGKVTDEEEEKENS